MSRRTNQIRTTMSSRLVAIVALAVSLQLCLCDTSANQTISELNTAKNEVSDDADVATTSSASRQKPLYSTGNDLWDNLIRDCLKKPSFSCIQKNVYTYLDGTLSMNDVNVTSKVQLTRNQLHYDIPATPKDEENEIYFEGRGENKCSRLIVQFGSVTRRESSITAGPGARFTVSSFFLRRDSLERIIFGVLLSAN